MTLNLNPVMSIIANVPAAIASTVRFIIPQGVSWRSVFSDCSLPRGSSVGKLLRNGRRDVLVSVSLSGYFNNPSANYSSTVNGSSGFRSAQQSSPPHFSFSKPQAGVHVQVSFSDVSVENCWCTGILDR